MWRKSQQLCLLFMKWQFSTRVKINLNTNPITLSIARHSSQHPERECLCLPPPTWSSLNLLFRTDKSYNHKDTSSYSLTFCSVCFSLVKRFFFRLTSDLCSVLDRSLNVPTRCMCVVMTPSILVLRVRRKSNSARKAGVFAGGRRKTKTLRGCVASSTQQTSQKYKHESKTHT